MIGPGGELIETAGTGEAPASAEPTGTLTEALLEVRDQLRSLNAEVQTLKQEVAELKARQHP
ncbi:hypothetical protein ACFQ2Y_24390 [Streptomyces malaysiensis subsp. malaysiensis]